MYLSGPCPIRTIFLISSYYKGSDWFPLRLGTWSDRYTGVGGGGGRLGFSHVFRENENKEKVTCIYKF